MSEAGNGPLRGRTVRTAAIAVLPLLISGCLFNRVVEVKQQACAFEENFELQFSEQPAVVMKKPVLLDEDILWMAGIQPTDITKNGTELLLTFEVEEDVPQPDPANDWRVDFAFSQVEEEYRLREIRLDPKSGVFFNESYLDRETILQAADNACNTGLGFGMAKMDRELTAEEVALLPTRPEVVQLVGRPHALSADGSGWEYRYRLKGQQAEEPIARITVWFDDDSEKPLRIESRYSRYQASADLESMKVSMNIDL